MAVQLIGSLIAILLLAGIAWALRLGGGGIESEAEACRAAEDALPGFVAVRAIVGSDGAAALIHGEDGSVAVIKRHGAQLAARRVAASALSTVPEGVLVDSGERLFGKILVRSDHPALPS